MKASTQAIFVLAALLALAVGWIVYSQIRGSAALLEARQNLEAAQVENGALSASNVTLRADNAALKKSNEAQATENRAQARQIAGLKGDIAAAKDVAGAAVGQGADLRVTMAAGEPIVEQLAVPALTGWYWLAWSKVDPLLATVDLLGGKIALLEPRVLELEAGNGRMQVLIDADAITIRDQDGTLAQQRGTIAAQAIDLQGAAKNVTLAIGRAEFGETLTWTCGGAAVGAVVGSFRGDPLSAAIGALLGAAGGFGGKLAKDLLLRPAMP